jgi:N-acetylmuramoyl-L-alanine amidase
MTQVANKMMREFRGKESGKVFFVFLSALLFLSFSGCASAPKKGSIQSYTISGVTYFSLVSLCDLKNLNWEYDPLTRTADLNRNAHRIRLQAGGKTIFVDGSPRQMNEPVDIYRGMLVVPGQFRQIVEALFPEYGSVAETISFYKIKKVIIDPGHGGKDPGATGSSGLVEKDVNLDIAKRLSGLLTKSGVETVLTRFTDKFIPLERRSELTENSGADLFISIHSNANKARTLSGFEVYSISSEVSDYKRALNSARSASLDLDSSSLSSSDLNLKAILWDMIYTYNRGEAIQLSKDICQSISRSVDTRIIGVKNANYCVLRGACVPAVLVEVGFLSNNKEERALSDPAYRQKIAEGIELGIRDYALSSSGAAAVKTNSRIAKSKEGAI